VIADARCLRWLASYAVVLADARPAALLATASYAVVRALCAPLLLSASSRPRSGVGSALPAPPSSSSEALGKLRSVAS
jgi:hypothetical protein